MVSPENAVKRWSEIDALRGLMLVLMTLTHLPTRFSDPLGQPFGFVSAAEGFVFLSAFMAGYIFAGRAMKDGVHAMRDAFLRRAARIYSCHVGMLMFLFTIVAAIGISTDRQTIKHLISFYLNDPVTALVSSLFLIYNPPLLDILPLYVVFMLLSPWLMIAALRLSWTPILLASGMIWLCAQFGLDREIYEAVATVTGLKVPFHETGAFDILAWQFIWIFGLWFGVRNATAWFPAQKLPPLLCALALAVGITGFLARHIMGQAPFGNHPMLAALLDKWHLGPLRVINFLALVVLTLRFGNVLKAALRYRILEILGAASLPVFCVHLIVVLLALAAVGDQQGSTSLWLDTTLVTVAFFAMYMTAWIFQPRQATKPTSRPGNQPTINARVAR